MLNPAQLHSDIVGGILQNFSGMMERINAQMAGGIAPERTTQAGEGEETRTTAFGEALAARLAENILGADEYEIQRIVNEELSAAVVSALDENRITSNELLSLFTRQTQPAVGSQSSLATLLNSFSGNSNAALFTDANDDLHRRAMTRMYDSLLTLER